MPRSDPAKCLHFWENCLENYRRCKVYHEIIRSRFPVSKPLVNNQRTATQPTPERRNSAILNHNGIIPGVS
jgi:hypothetical protein